MSKVREIIRLAERAQEKARVYQLTIHYLSEINDGLDGVAQEPGVSMLSRDTIIEVIEELRDHQEDVLEGVEKLLSGNGTEPKKSVKAPRKKTPPKKAPPKKTPPKKAPPKKTPRKKGPPKKPAK